MTSMGMAGKGWIGLLGMAVIACGVPSVEDARTRTPESGARATFGQPYGDVYRAGRVALERLQGTPDWKELEIRVDDPDAGVLIGERRLEGAVPGVRVRDLWSLYFTRRPEGTTQVTFLLESSDHPRATVPARSWAKGQESIFPVIREVLAAEVSRGAAQAPSPAPAVEVRRVTSPTARATPAPKPTSILDRADGVLRASEAWRVATHEETIAAGRVIVIGDWAQLTARGERCQIAFRDDPPAPAYDVARLMRFLADHDIPVDVLPASAFRRR